jgi:hypothetical protein
MSVVIESVIRESFDEVVCLVSGFHATLQFPVYCPKLHVLPRDVQKSMLRDWGPANIAAGIAQQLFLRFEACNVYAPFASSLRYQPRRECLGGEG